MKTEQTNLPRAILLCGLIFLCIAMTAFLLRKQSESEVDGAQGPVRPHGAMGYSDSARICLWQDEDDSQSLSISDWRDVEILESSKAISGAWSSQVYNHTLSFDVTAFGWRKKDHFVFAGVASNGDRVIERWKMKWIGQPGSGGTKVPARVEVYRGTQIGNPVAVSEDPDGRFVLLVAGSGASSAIISFPVQGNSQPTTLYSQSASLPIDQVRYINRYQHASLGRVWVLTGDPGASAMAIVLVDTSNDGAFDYVIVDNENDLYDDGALGFSTILESYERD